ncbi:MAG: DUF58 domain-containing protein [Acidimicrobiales bacterium]
MSLTESLEAERAVVGLEPAEAERAVVTLAPRGVAYAILAGFSLLAAVVLRNPALAALGIPSLLVLAAGLVSTPAQSREVMVEIRPERHVLTEGDSLAVTVVLRASRTLRRCTVSLRCPEGFSSRAQLPWLLTLPSSRTVEVETTLTSLEPGTAEIGPVRLTISGWSGLVHASISAGMPAPIEVRSLEQSLRTLPRSHRVRMAVGDRLAPSRGDGIELAEVRPQLPGEVVRRLNWRATARSGVPHVTMRHPEQSTDIVLLVDTFDDPSLSRVLSVAATAAAGYLLHRDRVGLVAFGGVLDWIEPGAGTPQLDRIRSRLASTTPFFSYAWKTIDRIPARALPRGSLVVAVSPLSDSRFTSALGALRGRGHELIVVEVASRGVEPFKGGSPPDLIAEAAGLLLRIEKDELRHRLWLRGIPVAPLLPGDPLEAAFAMLTEVRRRARPGIRRLR